MTEAAPGFDDDTDSDLPHCDLCGEPFLALESTRESVSDGEMEPRFLCFKCCETASAGDRQ